MAGDDEWATAVTMADEGTVTRSLLGTEDWVTSPKQTQTSGPAG